MMMIQNLKWDRMYSEGHINTALNLFLDMLSKVTHMHAPVKKIHGEKHHSPMA